MAFKRVDYLLDSIKRILRGLEVTRFSPDDILDALTEGERQLCREGLALRETTELTTLAGVAAYGVAGLIAITDIRPPKRWTEKLTVVENKEVWKDALTREISCGFPILVRPYAETVEFLPTPVVAGEKVSLDYARYPRVARLEPGTDPEVTMGWEPALKVAAMAELLGGDYVQAAARARELAATKHGNVLKGVPTRDHWSRTLGF